MCGDKYYPLVEKWMGFDYCRTGRYREYDPG